jgi:heptosyltransferase-2
LNSSDASLLIIGGEVESTKMERLKSALSQQRAEFAFNVPLPTLAGRIAACSLFIGHDSGITHLAAAAGVPVIALWAGTSPDVWKPSGDVTILRSSSGLPGLDVPSVLEAVTDTMKL